MKQVPVRLVFLAGLAMAIAIALPGGAEATSLHEIKIFAGAGSTFNDDFGQSVAVSGDTAVVGAPSENAFRDNYGAAYVFQRDQGGVDNWGEVIRLQSSSEGGIFGRSVAISGDTAVVGSGGKAHVFDRNQGGAGNWGEVVKLSATEAHAGHAFGISVAVSGDTALVGAPDTGFGVGSGVVYVFRRDQGGADNWGEVAQLTVSGASAHDLFGWSVAVSGGVALVGWPERISGPSPPTSKGVVYIFERNHGGEDNWGEVNKLTGSDTEPGDLFGRSLALSGETAVVGAFRVSSSRSGTGAAYFFQRNEGGADNWGEVKKITRADGRQGQFGYSVAVDGDTALVGEWVAELAYAFQRHAGGEDNWGEVTQLSASDSGHLDFFGVSVAVSGDTGVVGAPGEAGAPIKGCCGSAYVYDLLPPKPTLTGDVNCDGTVDPVDATLILQLRAGILGSLPCPDEADVNGDGNITSVDAALILQFTAGLLDGLP